MAVFTIGSSRFPKGRHPVAGVRSAVSGGRSRIGLTTFHPGMILEAERRMGELLQETERNKGSKGQLTGDIPVGGHMVLPPTDTTPTLAEMGLVWRDGQGGGET